MFRGRTGALYNRKLIETRHALYNRKYIEVGHAPYITDNVQRKATPYITENVQRKDTPYISQQIMYKGRTGPILQIMYKEWTRPVLQKKYRGTTCPIFKYFVDENSHRERMSKKTTCLQVSTDGMSLHSMYQTRGCFLLCMYISILITCKHIYRHYY